MQKESLAAREEMRKIKEELGGRKSASLCWRIRSTKTGWQMRRWRQSFRVCKLEKKEEVAMHRRQVMAAWRPYGSNTSPWKQMELRPLHKRFTEKWEQHKGKCQEEKKEEDSENEQEQGRGSQQLVSLTPGGVNQVAPASSLELDLPRVRGVPGEGGGAGRQVHPDRQDGFLGMRKGLTLWEGWCLETKKKEKQPGKGPKKL